MDDLFKNINLQHSAANSVAEEFHRELKLDQVRQVSNNLQELRLEEEKTTIFESERLQVIDQLRSIGNITVAQLELLLAKAGAVADQKVLAVIRALLEEKRISEHALANDAVAIIADVNFEHPTATDRELVTKIKAKFPLTIETLKLRDHTDE